MERRFSTELRATTEKTGERFIQGYASIFGQESTDSGLGFKEIVMPGAFARSLREGADVRALFNHDPNKILGRVKNGTLQLREDSRGLFYRVQLDPTNTDHMNMHAAITRGDVDECSFGFIAKSQEWSDVRGADGNLYAQRKLHDVDLMDVSAVVYPAYGNTSVVARSARVAFMFPEGDAEIRSAIAGLVEKRGGPKPGEEALKEVNKSGVLPAEVCDAWVKAYNDAFEEAVESKKANKEAHVIAIGCANKAISELVAKSPADVIDGSGGKADNDIPGEQVDDDDDEQEDAARATKLAEMEARNEHMSPSATDADCDDPTCWCQNRMVDPLDVWGDEDFDDPELDETSRAAKRAERKAAAEVESRAGKKARTKTVGGKHLPSSAFAYVGDPEKTETWKLPIHDADHVRNALARFNQTQGIPASAKAKVHAKIVAAAKKFGIHVSEENSSGVDAETAAMQVRVRVLEADLKNGL